MKTLENLIKAFIGESQARNRYTLYASVARKEKLPTIAKIFQETADNEIEHAEWLFKHIQELRGNSEELEVPAAAPLILGTTRDNLRSAIKGENYETTTMYPEFADVAEAEGFSAIAKRLRAIAKAEEHHRDRYQRILNALETGELFRSKEKKVWICTKCGYVHYGEEPPEVCPSCSHPRSYYKPLCDSY